MENDENAEEVQRKLEKLGLEEDEGEGSWKLKTMTSTKQTKISRMRQCVKSSLFGRLMEKHLRD